MVRKSTAIMSTQIEHKMQRDNDLEARALASDPDPAADFQ